MIKKTLGPWRLTALVTGNMVGSGVFLLPASLAVFGSIGLISWGFTAVGAILLALVFARLGRIMPKPGGPYAYCRAAYGDFIGFQVAYNYWIALWIGNAAITVALIGYLAFFFPILNQNPMAALLASLSVLWLVTIINIIGVREAGILQLITTIIKLIPLVLIALIGVFKIHLSNYRDFNISHQSNISAFTAAATLTLWSFIGFESATVPAGHVKNPEKNIPRATILGTLIAAVLYIASSFVIMGVLPMHVLAQSSSPYALAANKIFGVAGGPIIAIAAMIACLGTLNGWVLMQAQVPQAAAEDKLFPRSFAYLIGNGTPIVGLIISSVLISILLILRYGASLVDQFTFIILLATLASLIPYLLTTAAEFILYVKGHEDFQSRRLGKGLVIAIFAFIYAFWAISGAGKAVVYYGALLFFSGVPIYAWVYWYFRQEKLAR